jgi:hypothetical protein
MQFNFGPGLDKLKADASVEIDKQAEACRLTFITGGAGQAMEYQATEIEGTRLLNAIAAKEAVNEADYPFISAERAAYAANGVDRTLESVAQEVVQLSAAWAAVGSAIKEIRRTAKLKVDSAKSAKELLEITQNISWPTPGMK